MLINNDLFIVKKSKIHGKGLFAKKNIPANTIIWKFNNKIDHVIKKVDKLILKKYYRFKNFAYYSKKYNGWIYELDRAKWINHSENPNCISNNNITYTTKIIKQGNELTENYCKDYYYNYDKVGRCII
jgi:uncharacterized protein